MVALVSQTEAMRQLRLNEAALTTDEIGDVMFKAEQASAIIVDYLKRPFIEGPLQINPLAAQAEAPAQQDWSDFPPMTLPPWGWEQPVAPSIPPVPPPAWTPASVPVLVKGLILVVLTALYDGRTPEDVLLSDAVTSALWRMRDPALA